MTTIVIRQPDPIMTPGDIPGDHAANDPLIAAMIAAAVEQIDGPNGWLCRALGMQTLEHQLDGFPPRSTIDLPCPPIIEIERIIYLANGDWQDVDPDSYELLMQPGRVQLLSGFWPGAPCGTGSVRIRYKAGYDGEDISDGGTGTLPERVRQAVILMVRDMQDTGSVSADLKVEEVEGLSRREYFTSRSDSATLNRAVERLLAGLRVYR